MSKHFNEPFLMTPFSLLRTPEYIRLFDSTQYGSLFRVLATGVMRKGMATFTHANGPIGRLAQKYDEGWLSSYFTDEELVEALGLTSDRRVRSLRNKLVELKLIKVEEFRDGKIYTLGARLKYDDEDGYMVGDEQEGFFIDHWVKLLENDEFGFRRMLVGKLSEDAPKTAAHLLGNIFQDERKNFSRSRPFETTVKVRPAQDNSVAEKTPNVDNPNVDIKNNVDFPEKPAVKEKPARKTRPPSEDEQSLFEQVKDIYLENKSKVMPGIRTFTKTLRPLIKNVLSEQQDVDDWLAALKEAVDLVSTDAWYQGNNNRSWVADLPYFLRDGGNRVYDVTERLKSKAAATQRYGKKEFELPKDYEPLENPWGI